MKLRRINLLLPKINFILNKINFLEKNLISDNYRQTLLEGASILAMPAYWALVNGGGE